LSLDRKAISSNPPDDGCPIMQILVANTIGYRIRYCIDETPMEFDDERDAAQRELLDQLFQRENLDLLEVSLEKQDEEISE
jgi:hypothetical protein